MNNNVSILHVSFRRGALWRPHPGAHCLFRGQNGGSRRAQGKEAEEDGAKRRRSRKGGGALWFFVFFFFFKRDTHFPPHTVHHPGLHQRV